MSRPGDAWRPQFHTSPKLIAYSSEPDPRFNPDVPGGRRPMLAHGLIAAALALSLLGMLALFIAPAGALAASPHPAVHVVHDNGVVTDTGVTPCTFVSPDYHCHGAEYGNNKSHGNSFVTSQVQGDNLSCLFIPGHPPISSNAAKKPSYLPPQKFPPQAPCNGARVPFNGYREYEWDTSDTRTFSNGQATKPRYATNFGSWDNSKLDLRWYYECVPYRDDPAAENVIVYLIVGGTNSKIHFYAKQGFKGVCDGYDQEIDEDDIDQLIPVKYRNSNLHAHIEFWWNPNNLPGRYGDKENVRISVFAEHMFNPDPIQVP